MITGKLYDYLKWLAQVVLPGLGAAYFALAGLWGLPAAEEVAGTILVIDTFLGVLLGISQVNYGKQIASGDIVLEESDDRMTYQLKLDGSPEELINHKEVRFRVVK
jgi:hypothetical protein